MKKKLLLCALADFSEFAGPLVPPSLILYLLLAFAVFVPVPVPVCKCASVQVCRLKVRAGPDGAHD